MLLSNALGTFLLDLCKKISHSSVLCNSQNSAVWFSRFTSNRMYLTQNNGQEKIEEGKNSSNCSNTDEFLMSFFFITEWNYDGCWTRGEWIETGHSSRTFMFSTSISWTKPSSVHNPNLPKGNVFFRHHCERQHKTTKLFTVQYVGYMLLYAISRLAFLAVVQSCLPIRTRQGSWTKTMRWKNPRWSKPKFF